MPASVKNTQRCEQYEHLLLNARDRVRSGMQPQLAELCYQYGELEDVHYRNNVATDFMMEKGMLES